VSGPRKRNATSFKPLNAAHGGRVFKGIMRLAKRPEGATIREVADWLDVEPSVASSRLASMARRGRLWKQKLEGERVRYFAKTPYGS